MLIAVNNWRLEVDGSEEGAVGHHLKSLGYHLQWASG